MVADGLELFCRVRPVADRRRSITVALSNTYKGGGVERDPLSFFQPEIHVGGFDGAPFLERALEQPGTSDQDLRSYRLLYRNARVFAAGHGCAAEWDATEGGDRATAVRSTFMPTHSVPLAESNPAIDLEVLQLAHLASAPRETVLGGLRDLCDRYEFWISERRLESEQLETALRTTADQHLADCSQACERMRQGIDTIATDELAWSAFRLMNEAMLEQRAAPSGSAPARRATAHGETRLTSSRPGAHSSLRSSSCAFRASPASGRAGDRRPALVSDRRRQDRGLPRADRLHPVPSPAPR